MSVCTDSSVGVVPVRQRIRQKENMGKGFKAGDQWKFKSAHPMPISIDLGIEQVEDVHVGLVVERCLVGGAPAQVQIHGRNGRLGDCTPFMVQSLNYDSALVVVVRGLPRPVGRIEFARRPNGHGFAVEIIPDFQ